MRPVYKKFYFLALAHAMAACATDRADINGNEAADAEALSSTQLSATFCDAVNYGGQCVSLPLGAYSYTQMLAAGIHNDSVKSISLTSGASVSAYINSNYSGTAWTISGSNPNLSGLGASADISSFVVAPNPNTWFNLAYPHGSLCLDVTANSAADGANIEVWSCNQRASQAFRFMQLAPGVFHIVTQAGDKCLEVADQSNANLANVQQY